MKNTFENTKLSAEARNNLRKEKIAARENLSAEERTNKSKAIVERLAASEEFKTAKTILIYKAVRGEVRLESLEPIALACSKVLAYPLVISKTDMIALIPENVEAWSKGAFGIPEPIREKSLEVNPEDIDLIVCPCTSFDEEGGRMGMGAGYYDRFIPLAKKAKVVAVAFECQKAESVIKQPWDQAMATVFTEEKVYRIK